MASLKTRPDMRHDVRGFFEQEPLQLYNKEKVRDVSNDNLKMAKKYREIEKENYRKKLSRGLTDENFKADKAWRPGGSAIYTAKGIRRPDLYIKVQVQEQRQSRKRANSQKKKRRSSKSENKRKSGNWN